MIPSGTEQKVRILLAEGSHSIRGISKITGVSWGTVKAIRDSGGKRIPLMERTSGRLRKGSKKLCPKCHNEVVVWPCMTCNPGAYKDQAPMSINIYADIAREPAAKQELAELLCLANDVQEYAKIFGIEDPLMKSLAKRANDIFFRILKPRRADDE